jgi:hypothetical protein
MRIHDSKGKPTLLAQENNSKGMRIHDSNGKMTPNKAKRFPQGAGDHARCQAKKPSKGQFKDLE